MVIKESPVAQNRFYIDFVKHEGRMFTETGDDIIFKDLGKKEERYATKMLVKLGHNCKNIIYCNTVADTIDFARGFSSQLPDKQDERITRLIELIKTYIHRDYFLIDCLQKGVAFHFGRLPQRIRERIEKLFEEKVIDYIFVLQHYWRGLIYLQKIFLYLAMQLETRNFQI